MNWGLVGYGKIAKRFLAAMKILNSEQVVAIASLTNHRMIAREFSPEVKAYSTYQKLFQDPEVEVVYICTTHNLHKINVINALAAGKHVLCEKPISTSQAKVKSMVEMAVDRELFLMEAMWTRFLPAYRKMKEIIARGDIGKIVLLQANFGFRAANQDPEGRLFNLDLAGGSILDVGVYPITLMFDLFGNMPISVKTASTIHDTGIDTSCSMFFQFADNRSAHLYSSILTNTSHDAIITGERGWIRFCDFWHGTKLILHTNQKRKVIELPLDLNGFEYQIRACSQSIQNGLIEHPWMTHTDSLRIAAIADIVMQKAGYGKI